MIRIRRSRAGSVDDTTVAIRAVACYRFVRLLLGIFIWMYRHIAKLAEMSADTISQCAYALRNGLVIRQDMIEQFGRASEPENPDNLGEAQPALVVKPCESLNFTPQMIKLVKETDGEILCANVVLKTRLIAAFAHRLKGHLVAMLGDKEVEILNAGTKKASFVAGC